MAIVVWMVNGNCLFERVNNLIFWDVSGFVNGKFFFGIFFVIVLGEDFND